MDAKDVSTLDDATVERIIAADLANIVKKVKAGRPLSPTERKLIERKSTSTGSRTFDSMSHAAACLGVAVATLKVAKKSGCRAFRNGRVTEAELVQWLRDHQKELGATHPADMDSAKLAELLERVRQRRRQNDLADGILVPKSKVLEEFQKVATPIKSLLRTKLELEFPSAIAGMDVPQCRIFGRRLEDAILAELAKLFGGMAI